MLLEPANGGLRKPHQRRCAESQIGVIDSHSLRTLCDAVCPCTSFLEFSLPSHPFDAQSKSLRTQRELPREAGLGVCKEWACPSFNGTIKRKLRLLASLEALLGCMKSLHATLGAVMADLAALRNTVFEDPGDMAGCRANLESVVSAAKLLVDEVSDSCDDLLQELIAWQPYTH